MKIVAIGGGDIGRNNTKYETGKIDKKIVEITNKDKPNFLFISLASSFGDSYYKVIKNIYKDLGCETGKISNKTLTHMEVVEQKIKKADIIYVGGGDTLKLISILKENNMDKMITEALDRGCVLAGISAGAILACKYGLSDVEIMNNISDKYIKINGLGYLDYMFVPHFDTDEKKENDLKEALKGTNINALCFDNGTAIIVDESDTSLIRSIPGKKVYKIYYKNDEYIKQELEFDKKIEL